MFPILLSITAMFLPTKADPDSQRTCEKCQKTFGSLGGWKYHTSNNVCKPKPSEPAKPKRSEPATEAGVVKGEGSLKEDNGKGKDRGTGTDEGKESASRSTNRRSSAKVAAVAAAAAADDDDARDNDGREGGGQPSTKPAQSTTTAKTAASSKMKDKGDSKKAGDKGKHDKELQV